MKIFFLYVMALIYIAAGINHFRRPRIYLKIIPPYMPRPEILNYLSGAAEIFFGLLLFWPETRSYGAGGLILLLIAVFPANIYMYQARHTVFKTLPAWGLFLRLPLQIALMAWAALYI
jgi:uncharacterized membrane protein